MGFVVAKITPVKPYHFLRDYFRETKPKPSPLPHAGQILGSIALKSLESLTESIYGTLAPVYVNRDNKHAQPETNTRAPGSERLKKKHARKSSLSGAVGGSRRKLVAHGAR
tara:strand:+ start:190 stop:522 length:333 start_codon:yes stop_codon:yes gene_type:complete